MKNWQGKIQIIKMQYLNRNKTSCMKYFLLPAVIFFSTTINAQLGGLKNKILNTENNPVASLMKKPSPITTNFKEDVKMEGSLPESFGNDKTFTPLHKMPFEANEFQLCPGYYEMTNMSYCLKAGTHGPSEGDGYMYAPVKGKMDDIVISILENHAKHPEISQRDVQVLLWAIIARAKFKNLSGRLKIVTTQLLTPKQIVKLNGGFVETLGGEALNKGLVDVPPAVQKVMEAENNIRRLVETGVDSYEDFEKFAILAGMAPNDNKEVVRGMWSLHPDGYYIRYFPSGYSRTTVQIYVPEGKDKVKYNAIGTIACPANTGAQRLAQTNMPLEKKEGEFRNPCLL
jgi:hypothetical protein